MSAASPATASRPAVPWLAIGLLLAAVIGLQMLRDRVSPPAPEAPPILWVQSPELARRIALGFDDIAADLYWIRAVVLYGANGGRRANRSSATRPRGCRCCIRSST